MAEIVPFRGILYQPHSDGAAQAASGPASDVSAFLAPPYDVISESQRQALAARSPYNAVHLILPKDVQGGETDGRYTEAARTLDGFLAASVMRRDSRPALYRYHQIFTPPDSPGTRVVRRGFICRIRLHRFAEGIILPHERTLAGPKADRLKLKRATRTHLSQVFGLYDDPARAVDAVFADVEQQPPELSGTTDDGVEHQLWRLSEPTAIEAAAALLRDQRIYIADGHHRYETMLALRDELRREPGYRGSDSGIEYGSIFLCNASDPGLLVFPTHRVLHSLPGFELEKLLAHCRSNFIVDEQPIPSATSLRETLREKGRAGPSYLLLSGGRAIYLTLRADAETGMAIPGPAVLRTLDVTVLHTMLLEQALGIDRAAQEAQTYLRYLKDNEQALAASRDPGVQAVFLLNPTRVEQVMAVSNAGEVMPQKSTYFYPKIASGLVLNPLDPAEPVDAVGSRESSR